jgi:hypothetical protein
MAHFAKIENNVVTQVLVVSDNDAPRGQDFLANDLGLGGTWIQTSYNTRGNVHSLSGTPLRGNYAGVGYTYDSTNDVFYPPQPFPSWSISAATNWLWAAPVPYPTDSKMYRWDEPTTNWIEVPGRPGS